MRLIHSTEDRTAAPRSHRDRPVPQLVRAMCAQCGTHSNALKTFRLTGSCTNCGSFDLVAIDGAAPLGGPVGGPVAA